MMKINIFNYQVEITVYKPPQDPFSLSTLQMKIRANLIDRSIVADGRSITRLYRIKYARAYFKENGYPKVGLIEARDWCDVAFGKRKHGDYK